MRSLLRCFFHFVFFFPSPFLLLLPHCKNVVFASDFVLFCYCLTPFSSFPFSFVLLRSQMAAFSPLWIYICTFVYHTLSFPSFFAAFFHQITRLVSISENITYISTIGCSFFGSANGIRKAASKTPIGGRQMDSTLFSMFVRHG